MEKERERLFILRLHKHTVLQLICWNIHKHRSNQTWHQSDQFHLIVSVHCSSSLATVPWFTPVSLLIHSRFRLCCESFYLTPLYRGPWVFFVAQAVNKTPRSLFGSLPLAFRADLSCLLCLGALRGSPLHSAISLTLFTVLLRWGSGGEPWVLCSEPDGVLEGDTDWLVGQPVSSIVDSRHHKQSVWAQHTRTHTPTMFEG